MTLDDIAIQQWLRVVCYLSGIVPILLTNVRKIKLLKFVWIEKFNTHLWFINMIVESLIRFYISKRAIWTSLFDKGVKWEKKYI